VLSMVTIAWAMKPSAGISWEMCSEHSSTTLPSKRYHTARLGYRS